MTAFFGFGATLPRLHESLFMWTRNSMVLLCVAIHACATLPGGRPIGSPGDVGPEGRPPFLARVFRARTKPGTGPVLRHSRHVPQHTMPGSGRAPGLPAGPGSFFGHCGKIWVFPSFGNSFGVPHPGMYGSSQAAKPITPIRHRQQLPKDHWRSEKLPRGFKRVKHKARQIKL